jgi:hypothetical protein
MKASFASASEQDFREKCAMEVREKAQLRLDKLSTVDKKP